MSASRKDILDQIEAEACAEIAPSIPSSLLPELARVARSLRVNPADLTTLGFLLENPGSGAQARLFAPLAARYRSAFNRIKSVRAAELAAVEAAAAIKIEAQRALNVRRKSAAVEAERTFVGQRWEQVGSGTDGYGIARSEARETAAFRAHVAAAVAEVV